MTGQSKTWKIIIEHKELLESFILSMPIPSKKNNKRIYKKKVYKIWVWWVFIPFIASSPDYKQWEARVIPEIKYVQQVHKINKKDYPLLFHYVFFFENKKKHDLSNIVESINDMLVKAKIIEDDDHKFIPNLVLSFWWYVKDPKVKVFIYKK